jgi:hypothetical protein
MSDLESMYLASLSDKEKVAFEISSSFLNIQLKDTIGFKNFAKEAEATAAEATAAEATARKRPSIIYEPTPSTNKKQ